MASAAEKPRRPRIVKPKKRHNYRNLIPSYSLVPLSLGTEKIEPFLTKLPSPNQPSKRWTQPPPSVTPTHLQGKEAAINFPPLSVCARGELTVTPTTQPDAAQIPGETTSLIASAKTGNLASQQPASPLSADAEVFTPAPSLSPKANTFFPSLNINTELPPSPNGLYYDPWGNVVQCSTPDLAHLDYPPSSPNAETYEELPPHQTERYSPTIPNPFFLSPNSWSNDSPNNWFSNYDDWSPNNTGYCDCFHNPNYDIPTPSSWTSESTFSSIHSPTNNFASDEDLSTTGPSTNSVTTSPSQVPPRPRDPVDRKSLETRKIVSQNVRGWKSSLKKDALIDLMIREDISAMCIQETWEAGFNTSTIRGYLVIQQNLSEEEWRKRAKSARGGIRKGVHL